MSKLFEAFKQYHNANHHDGENHFDDEIYKKSNGEDFNNPFVQECFDHFESAWQERQKVIEKLENKITDLNKNLKDRESAALVRQEIINSALTVLKSLKSENDLWGCDQVSVQIDLLENTLRGEP